MGTADHLGELQDVYVELALKEVDEPKCSPLRNWETKRKNKRWPKWNNPMNDLLSVSEIKSRYASEWVLLDDPQTSPTLEVQAGRVVCHSKDRDEVYRKAVELRPKRFAVLYTGTMPKGTAIILSRHGSGRPERAAVT